MRITTRETILSSGVLNVETNWYNEGMVVSNSSSSAVVTATCPVDYEYDVYGNRIAMTTYRDISLSRGRLKQTITVPAAQIVTQATLIDRMSDDGGSNMDVLRMQDEVRG